jgi:hypothetical protein
MSLFLDMDAACHYDLSPDQIASIEPALYVRILTLCAKVAESTHWVAHAEERVPMPPATQHIRADFVLPDDYTWRTDLSFDQVETADLNRDEVVLVYHGGRTVVLAPTDQVRVAVSPEQAQKWNRQRVSMGESTLRSVAEAYGVY